MSYLAAVGVVAIFFVIYSIWNSVQTSRRNSANMQELALSDYMKVKKSIMEWKSNPDIADAEGRAIASAKFFREIMMAHTFTNPAHVKTKVDALRFTYCNHFARLKKIDDDYVHGDNEFVIALNDIAEIERGAAAPAN